MPKKSKTAGFHFKRRPSLPASAFIRRDTPKAAPKTPITKDDPTVKQFLELKDILKDRVSEEGCEINLSTGELVSWDWANDYEGIVPVSEKDCNLPYDVSQEIDRLYKQYEDLTLTDSVQKYQDEERRKHHLHMEESRKNFRDAAIKCQEHHKSNPKAIRACRAQHIASK